MSNVVKLASKAPRQSLEALNRMTGLVFDHWPESLVDPGSQEQRARQVDAGPLTSPGRQHAGR